MKLSEKIVYLRKDKGWSQEQLAIKLDISRQAVYKWEADIAQPDIEKLKKIASLFNVSYDILMNDEISLPIAPNIVEAEDVEIIEKSSPASDAKVVTNEVAVQINYGKEMARQSNMSNKKSIILVSTLVGILVISLVVLSYILFGIVLQRESYIVKFDTLVDATIEDQIVKEGKTVKDVSSPTKSGYTFDGWYIGEKKWDFKKDTIKGNATLTAKWIPNSNTITYVNIGTTEKRESVAHTDETVSLVKNQFTKAGHTFIGWSLTPNGEVDYNDCASFKMGDKNVTLYAVWSTEHYNLVLNSYSGIINSTVPTQFTANDSIILPIPTLKHFDFMGWYNSSNEKVELISKGTIGDIVLNAKYEPISYSIRYELDGGINDENNPFTYNVTSPISFKTPTKDGYYFDGWYSDIGLNDYITSTSSIDGGNLVLYAKWIRIINISYELDGGTNNSLNPSSILETESFTLKSPSKDGYSFGGWYFDNNFSEPATVINNSSKAKTTVYAKWLKIINLNYVLDGGINNTKNPKSIYENETVILKSPTKNGYKFGGWYLDGGFNAEADSIEGNSTINEITLYAKWLSYTNVSYELYGGTNNALNSVRLAEDESFTLKAPVRDGYIFNGWFLDSSFTSGIDTITYELAIGHTIYASWTADIKFTFTSNGSGGYILTGCTGIDVVEIPATHEGAPVVEISDSAFYEQRRITEIIIPASVTKIGYKAFNDCSRLTSFTVKSGNTYYSSDNGILYCDGGKVLQRYPIRKPDLVYTAPSTLDVIEDYAFYGCIFLEEVYLPDDKTLTYGVGKISTSSFENCINLKKIELGYTANYFEASCFSGTKLESIEFKCATINGIEKNAFKNCIMLQSVVFHGAVEIIGNRAFYNCSSLTYVDLGNTKRLDSHVFDSSGLRTIYIPDTVIEIGDNTFLNGKSPVILCQVAEKPSAWHEGWSNGASSVLWSQADGIDKPQFSFAETQAGQLILTECKGAGVIYIPSAHNGLPVTQIAPGAFMGQDNIVEIIIPSTITTIEGGFNIFDECTSLEYIRVDGSNTAFTDINGILYNKNQTCLIAYPRAKKDKVFTASYNLDVIGSLAFYGNPYLEEVNLPNDADLLFVVGRIYPNAFDSCTALKKIELGYVNYLDAQCFRRCTALESIVLRAEKVYGICRSAFEGCSSLASVEIYGEVDLIEDTAFKDCTALKRIDLGGTIAIGSNVFENTGLTQIFIPISVTKFGKTPFLGCDNLYIYCAIDGRPNGWDESWWVDSVDVLWNQPALPGESTFTFSHSSNALTLIACFGNGVVTIPSQYNGVAVKAIDSFAFSGQTGITEIIIPDSVVSINPFAFDDCPSLEKITYQNSDYYLTIDGVLYRDYGSQLYKYPEGKKDIEFNVPVKVDVILANAFKNNKHIQILTMSDNKDYRIGKLESSAFEGCISLKQINNCYVDYLEPNVFKGCSALEGITFLADDVWGIGNQSFLNCTSLKSVTFIGNMHEIGYQVFGNCSNLSKVDFQGELKALSMHTFENCTSLTSIALPNGLKVIPSEVFKGCANLKEVAIPSTVTKIEDYAFLNTGIKKIFIPSTVTEIEAFAFVGCTDLIIYCEPEEKPNGWNEKWNIENETGDTYHQVIWKQAYDTSDDVSSENN